MIERIAIVAVTSLVYCALFYINGLLFSPLAQSVGVAWIFLPSGLRLAFVLVLGRWGALGIFFGTLLTSLFYYDTFNPVVFFCTAAISGFSPLLARQFARQYLDLTEDLSSLNARKLVQTSALFAVLSASMHQVFYVAYGMSDNFVLNTLIMTAGDFTGSLIVLYMMRHVLLRRRLKTF